MTKTIKLKLLTDTSQDLLLKSVCNEYKKVCNFISDWIFDNGFVLNFMRLQDKIYHSIREDFQLNSQMVISALKTVTARYKTTKEQLSQNPYRYQDDKGKWQYITKTLEWLRKPVNFRIPQCDLVRNRNYRLLSNGKISITTLEGTISVDFLARLNGKLCLMKVGVLERLNLLDKINLGIFAFHVQSNRALRKRICKKYCRN